MLYNKNNVRKTNDKKILHKVGKQWKVISVALLMAIGGGAAVAATNNANANADATDNAYNDATGVNNNTAAQAEALENNDFNGNFAKSSAAPKSASKSTAKPSFANISYAPSERYAGNNASAASYKNNASFDAANINYYGPIVKGYIDQINAKYPEARSLEDNYNDLQGKTNQAKSAANSYKATANDPSTAATISAKAGAAHQTTSDYTDSVAYHVLDPVNGFMPQVSNTAKLASEESVVASYATLVSEINGNKTLSTEYHDKYELASASVTADKALASDENAVAKSVNANSSANLSQLASNSAALNTLSLGDQLASINSVVDSSAVGSVASSAGYKYNSSVVSSAVSLVASELNHENNGVATKVDADSVAGVDVTAMNNNSGFNDNGAVTLADNSLTVSAVSRGDTNAVINLNDDRGNNSASAIATAVSDTAAQQAYASSASTLNSTIAQERKNVSVYNLQVSSANSAAASAGDVLTASESAKAEAYFLGNHPQISNLFGTPENVPFYDASKVNGRYANALKDALADAGANDNTKEAQLVPEVNNAKQALKGALDNMGNYTDAGNGKYDDSHVPNPALKDALHLLGAQNGVTNGNDLVNIIDKLATDVNAIKAADLETSPTYNTSLYTGANRIQIKGVIEAAKNVTGGTTLTNGSSNQSNVQSNITIVNNALNELINPNVNVLNKGGHFDLSDLGTSTTGANNPSDFNSSSGKYGNGSFVSAIRGLLNAYGVVDGQTFDPAKAINATDALTNLDASSLVSGTPKTSTGLDGAIEGDVGHVDSNSTYQNAVKKLVEDPAYGVTKLANLKSDVNGLSAVGLTNGSHKYNASKVQGTYANAVKELLADAGINSNSTLSDMASAVPNMLAAINGLGANNLVTSRHVYVGGLLKTNGDYASAANDTNVTGTAIGINAANDSLAVSDLNSTANSAGSAYNSVSSASASYAKATDQDVTIASQFSSYYNSIANSDATLASNAKGSLDNFRATHASNPTAYASADSAYTSASNAEPNDKDFAYAYGKNVLLNTPEFITVKKNAMLHSGTQYAKANSVKGVKAGSQYGIIKGVGFDKAGNVRYVVADPNGKNYYITANDAYVKNTYLAPSVNYTVTLNKDAVAHKTLGFSKDVDGTIAAGTQLDGYTVPTSTKSGRRDASYGVTRLQIKGGKYDGDYITTNCKYLNIVSVNGGNEQAANSQDTNPVQNSVNFAD